MKRSKKAQKLGRNAPCACGSGRKSKNCCGELFFLITASLDDGGSTITPVSEEQHEEILRLIEASHERGGKGPCLVCEYLRSQGLPAHGSRAA